MLYQTELPAAPEGVLVPPCPWPQVDSFRLCVTASNCATAGLDDSSLHKNSNLPGQLAGLLG